MGLPQHQIRGTAGDEDCGHGPQDDDRHGCSPLDVFLLMSSACFQVRIGATTSRPDNRSDL
jgi:hypothetical protein